MRLWSLHPQYLDRQGLTACWREALLAQAVLAGRTRGYLNHSQLHRFRARPDPLATVGAYLVGVAEEATARSYRFDTGRIDRPAAVRDGPAAVRDGSVPRYPASDTPVSNIPVTDALVTVAPVPVTEGQIDHEWRHLMAKLARREPQRAAALTDVTAPAVHPLFMVVPGPMETWERGTAGPEPTA